jgi:hypothetical protein
VDIGSGVERCRACDPSNDDGCATGEHCSAAFVCGP